FNALSYCWGDANVTTGIFVNGLETQVTKNLADALLQLRAIGVRRVWADAICINQADRREQTHQLRVMRNIYERAATTFAWIGRDGSDRAASAIRFLQTLANSGEYFGARDIFDFEALQSLLNREYWKRRWIIQELAVASQAQI
ncbi:heterokaryon incompatibility, partial [Stipitochalara longipes BDJ]